ncbi:hypothetical protein Ga0061069_10313 [Thiomonas bhubaneswarensis]|uniref:Uncharacterized protein n=1 Tax=Thiomonas bhubaneswarensis TaxID=339866 RepID=A0A0K6HWV6_9BURK|nr:hypothetical protein Ga0061069_10313 [Thiomonas bhubaneswarensis]
MWGKRAMGFLPETSLNLSGLLSGLSNAYGPPEAVMSVSDYSISRAHNALPASRYYKALCDTAHHNTRMETQ